MPFPLSVLSKQAHTEPATVEDAERRRVIAAWANLPEAFRRAVLALVDSTVAGAR